MRGYQIHATALAGCTVLIPLSASCLDTSTYGISLSEHEVRLTAPDSPGRARRLHLYPHSRRSRRQ